MKFHVKSSTLSGSTCVSLDSRVDYKIVPTWLIMDSNGNTMLILEYACDLI